MFSLWLKFHFSVIILTKEFNSYSSYQNEGTSGIRDVDRYACKFRFAPAVLLSAKNVYLHHITLEHLHQNINMYH